MYISIALKLLVKKKLGQASNIVKSLALHLNNKRATYGAAKKM